MLRLPLLIVAALALIAPGLLGADPAGPSTLNPQPSTNIWLLIIPVAVPIIIAVIKIFLPKLPTVWLPILAPVLGALIDFLANGNFGAGTILAAIAGSAGVGLREILDQVKKLQAPKGPQ